MKFVNHASYIADQKKIADLRPQHRDYLSDLMKQGKIVAAGPYADGSGTLIVYELADQAEAQAIVDADPFTTGGVFVSCELKPWKIVFSEPKKMTPD